MTSSHRSAIQYALIAISGLLFLLSLGILTLLENWQVSDVIPYLAAFLLLIAVQYWESGTQTHQKQMVGAILILILAIATLYLADLCFSQTTPKNGTFVTSQGIQQCLASLWWLVSGILLNLLLLRFVLEPLERKFQRKIPSLIKYLLSSFFLTTATFGLLAFVFHYKMGGAVALSGFLMGLVGLSIRSHAGNVIAGIVLGIERPFLRGDWITIDGTVAKVIDISWRCTRLQTFQNATLTIPNDTVARANILNWDRQEESFGQGYWIFQTLHFHPHHDPALLTQLLHEALDQVKSVDDREALAMKWVKCVEVDEYGLRFAIAFDCTDRLLKNSQEHEVLLSIHKILREHGISIANGMLRTHPKPDPSTEHWPLGGHNASKPPETPP